MEGYKRKVSGGGMAMVGIRERDVGVKRVDDLEYHFLELELDSVEGGEPLRTQLGVKLSDT